MADTAVIVTRPEPDATAFADALAERGLRPVLSPALVIRPLATERLGAGAVVAFTSSNGVRSVLPAPEGLAFAVGPATAAAAREAGWADVIVSGGDSVALAGTIAAARAAGQFEGEVIHIAGSHRAGDLVALLGGRGVKARRWVAYEAVAADAIGTPAVEALTQGGPVIVTHFSPRSAAIFSELAARAEMSLAHADAVCLSEAVAAVLCGAHWRSIVSAERPETAAMIETILEQAQFQRTSGC